MYQFVKFGFVTLLLGAVVSSCVSTSTYEAMVAWKDSLQVSNDSLEQVIAGKITNINSRDKEIENYKQQLARMQKELVNARENYEKLKASASGETQELYSRIETLQSKIVDLESKLNTIDSKLRERDEAMNRLKETLTAALLNFKDSGLTVEIKDGKVYVSLSNQLLFKSGSTEIDKKGQEALIELAGVLQSQEDLNVLVEGHTDNQMVRSGQRFSDNWDLSVLRATEVTRFLCEKGGFPANRVTASGRGEYFPVQVGESPEIRAINRRTEIILTPKLDIIYEMFKN